MFKLIVATKKQLEFNEEKKLKRLNGKGYPCIICTSTTLAT